MSHSFHSRACGCDPSTLESGQLDSLYPYINTQHLRCLNESEPNMAARAIRPYEQRHDSDRWLDSAPDSDEDEDSHELLLHVPFVSTVTVKSVTVRASGDTAPLDARLFVNRDDLDLSTVGDTSPVQTLALAEDSDGSIDHPVKLAKFQSVSSLLIHFKGNRGGDRIRVEWLHVKGVSTGGRREAVNVVYEAIARPSDHQLTHLHSSSMQLK